jgi:hypothetical protein
MVGHMSKFKRGLRTEAFFGLEQLTNSQGDNWWKELLRHWAPSGWGEGLRLAVRFNTLDFYFRGHCVAHVGFARRKRGEPASAHMKCHVRYIFGDEISGQQHASFDAEERLWKHKEFEQARSLNEILNYIRMWKGEFTPTGKRRKASEKAGVDAIVGSNKTVIDLEMALPAWEQNESALRMDLVSLEQTETRSKLHFGRQRRSMTQDSEAKRSRRSLVSCSEKMDVRAMSTTSNMATMKSTFGMVISRHVLS